MKIDFDEVTYEIEKLLNNPPDLDEMRRRVEGMVWGFYHFDTDDEFYKHIRNRIDEYFISIMADLYSLDKLLTMPDQSDFLFDVVLWRAGRAMENKETGIKFMQDFADKLREILGDKAPPKT